MGDTPDTMNIVIGLEGLALGGCPINALDLGRALRDRGHRVSVFAIDEDVRVSLLPYAEQSGFGVERLPSRAATATRARQIREVANRHDADVVHVFAPWLGPAAAVAMGSRRRGIAVVTNWMMSNVSYVPQRTPMVVGTRSMQQEAQAGHAARVWLMEPPVDVRGELAGSEGAEEFRRRHGLADDEIAAVIVGRVDSHMKAESLRYAIGAIVALDEPRLKLVIVGDGDAFDEIRRTSELANERLGRRAVVMAGVMYDPRPAYAAADITLAMGGSALRSLTHGKPLIVLGENGFARTFGPESIEYFLAHGFYGEKANDQPVQHMQSLIRRLLDTELRARLGKLGRDFVAARFALDRTAEMLEDIYRRELNDQVGRFRRSVDAGHVLGRALGHEALRWTRDRRAAVTPRRALRRGR